MTALNTANKLFLGATPINRVYLGASKVWEPAAVGPASSLVVSYTPGSDRNDFGGMVGVRIGIGGTGIPVNMIGVRVHHASWTGIKTLKLYEWFSSALQRSANVDVTGKAVGSWVWTAIPPITLGASGYYSLMMDVVAYDGQPWGNTPAPVSMVAGITNIYGCYYAGGFGTTGINEMFNGVDLGAA